MIETLGADLESGLPSLQSTASDSNLKVERLGASEIGSDMPVPESPAHRSEPRKSYPYLSLLILNHPLLSVLCILNFLRMATVRGLYTKVLFNLCAWLPCAGLWQHCSDRHLSANGYRSWIVHQSSSLPLRVVTVRGVMAALQRQTFICKWLPLADC
jgi:hypothetical protein